jgi:hypothetical protein
MNKSLQSRIREVKHNNYTFVFVISLFFQEQIYTYMIL